MKFFKRSEHIYENGKSSILARSILGITWYGTECLQIGTHCRNLPYNRVENRNK